MRTKTPTHCSPHLQLILIMMFRHKDIHPVIFIRFCRPVVITYAPVNPQMCKNITLKLHIWQAASCNRSRDRREILFKTEQQNFALLCVYLFIHLKCYKAKKHTQNHSKLQLHTTLTGFLYINEAAFVTCSGKYSCSVWGGRVGGAQRQDQHFEGTGSGLLRHGLRGYCQGHHQGRRRHARSSEDGEWVGKPERANRVPEWGVRHEGLQLPPCGKERDKLVHKQKLWDYCV